MTEDFYRLALQYQPNYTIAVIKKLISEFGSATNIFLHSEPFFHRLHKRNKNIKKPYINSEIGKKVDRELTWLYANNAKLCFYNDQTYPYRLKNCCDAPYMFSYIGNGNLNQNHAISVVGTRSASSYGKDCVKELISQLSSQNVNIVSGLAEGIDTFAHQYSIKYNTQTTAVVGSGLSIIYPDSNRELFYKIIDNNGAVISEYTFDAIPDRLNFPRRNRIIAGLTEATVVVESDIKGGSIITASIASSYHRDIFAFPGSVFCTNHAGCHDLIRKNIAALITSGNDVIEYMGWSDAPQKNVQRSIFVDLDELELEVINIIQNNETILLDELSGKLPHLRSSKIAGILLGLEIKGVIEQLAGKRYKII